MERSDYVALLNRAILQLDENTPQTRSQIFDRARRALRSQLEAIEPPLPQSKIEREQQQLEDAIRQIEPPRKIEPAAARKAPPQPTRAVASREIFCSHCVAETTDETPGDVSTINGIGRQFYGAASPCPECGSVIRTLWWTLVEAPVVPLGSYRYKTSEEAVSRARFWCRKLPKRYWPQIWKTWAIGLIAVIAVAIGFYIYYHYFK
jgi:hypothetical protein